MPVESDRGLSNPSVTPEVLRPVSGGAEAKIVQAILGHAHEIPLSELVREFGVRAYSLGAVERPDTFTPDEIATATIFDTEYPHGLHGRRAAALRPGEVVAFVGSPQFTDEGALVLQVKSLEGRVTHTLDGGSVPPHAKSLLEQHRDVGFMVRVGEGGEAALYPNVVLLPENPTVEQVDQLPLGARVSIAGTVLAIGVDSNTKRHVYEIGAGEDGDPMDIVRLEVEQFGGGLAFEDGVLDSLSGKKVRRGDTITVTCLVAPTTGSMTHTLEPHDNQAFLIAPSQERQEAYDALRLQVVILLGNYNTSLDNGDYASARGSFAKLRSLELTQGEGGDVLALWERFLPAQRPFYADGLIRNHDAKALDEDYGVLVESMKRREFLDFASQAAGDIRDGRMHVGPVSRLVLERYGTSAAFWIVNRALDERINGIDLKGDIQSRNYEIAGYKAALDALAEIGIPNATAKLFASAGHFIERCMDADGTYSNRLQELVAYSTSALLQSLEKYPSHELVLRDKVSELTSWIAELDQHTAAEDESADENYVNSALRRLKTLLFGINLAKAAGESEIVSF